MKVKLKDLIVLWKDYIPDIAEEVLNIELDEMQISQCFSIALKELRRYKKISLQALANIVDIPNPSISRYENGLVIPTIPQAIKLTAYFELPIELFVCLGLVGLEGGDLIEIYINFIHRMNAAKNKNREKRRGNVTHPQPNKSYRISTRLTK